MGTAQHLFLSGYRGTGKTSVGRLVATRLSLPFVDLDDVIQTRSGQTIREIFAAGGEASFRDLESAALAEVIGRPRSVIALGGGTILRAANRALIHDGGICVWLDAEAELLAERIAADTVTAAQRPPLTSLSANEEIAAVLETRRPLYEAVADVRIEIGRRTVAEVADDVLSRIDAKA